MEKSKGDKELRSFAIGYALAIAPFWLLWTSTDRLGVSGSIALFLTGMLGMASSLLYVPPGLARYAAYGIGTGIIVVGVMGAIAALLAAVWPPTGVTP